MSLTLVNLIKAFDDVGTHLRPVALLVVALLGRVLCTARVVDHVALEPALVLALMVRGGESSIPKTH